MALSAVVMLSGDPAAAQDVNDTIADILVKESEGEAPEFDTLLEAIGNADEDVLATLINRDAQVSLFAPTDMAFSALAEAMGEEAFTEFMADDAALTELMFFHIVDGIISTEEITTLLDEDTDSGFSLGTLNGQYVDVAYTEIVPEAEATAEAIEVTPQPLSREPITVVTINGARLRMEMSDINAANGIIHVIDSVMLPEEHTIAELIVARAEVEDEDVEPEFTLLLGMIGNADQTILQGLMDTEAEFTLFAPTDAAFEAFIDTLGEERYNALLDDPDALNDLLRYHMVASAMSSRSLSQRLADAANSGDENGVEVEMMNGDVVQITSNQEGELLVNGALLTTINIDAANGVIHVIDAVLIPPSLEDGEIDEAEETEEVDD
jgi:uncharacterized surface protein with fasciclin (FAS1) repeats